MSSSGFTDVWICITLLGFIIHLLSANGLMLEQDLDALLAFHNATDRANLLAWSTNTDPCKWQGITCINSTIGNNSTRERVFRINLPGAGISGTIPSGILGALNELTVLSLRSNFISGPVPADIVNCNQLRNLALQRNRFSGPLPWDFSAWPRLVRLDLSFNEFQGSIPKSLSELPRLKTLLLQNNSFTGDLPGVQFRGAVEFSVANNQLSGPIPATLSQLPPQDFTGNDLCGPPLEAPCAFAPAPHTETVPSTGAPSAPKKKIGTRLGLGAILAIVIGDAAALAVLTTLFLLCYWHRQHKQLARAAGAAVANAKSGSDKSSSEEFRSDYSSSAQGDPQAGKLVFLKTSKRNFSLEDLLRASAEMIGQGCLGTSYRAVLEDGEIVTVKRIKGIDLGSKEFEQKMAVMGEFKHENLQSPRAYYYSKAEKLVVTEFVPRGSLALHLHGDDKDAVPLDWSARLRIALGAARGVAYLHEFGQVVHGNIKSSNVLLSRGLEARVADHGLIQMLSPDGAISASLAGYRAPEVTAIKKFTQQSDVYAFGVLLLELLTGRAPWRTNQRGERIDLPRWVQSVVREEWTEEVFDQAILRFSEEEMVQMLQIALTCVATLPEDRPKMKSVVKMIEDVREWGPSAASDGSVTRSSDEQQQSYTESSSLEATLPHVEGPLPRRS